jgi:chromosome segregation ATPase
MLKKEIEMLKEEREDFKKEYAMLKEELEKMKGEKEEMEKVKAGEKEEMERDKKEIRELKHKIDVLLRNKGIKNFLFMISKLNNISLC